MRRPRTSGRQLWRKQNYEYARQRLVTLMVKQTIGNYQSYILEAGDMVVIMGEVDQHVSLLKELGFDKHPETKEYVGTGACLYRMSPDRFYDLFSCRSGEPELVAQATDQEKFYQIDSLPVVEEDDAGNTRITQITALDFETRKFIDEGVSNFRVG